jgi:hypothetical protein
MLTAAPAARSSSSSSSSSGGGSKLARALQADKNAGLIATVRVSWLPNAGKGAFAIRKISAGEVLGTYQGHLLSRDEYESSERNAYTLQITHPQLCYIDASNPATAKG